MKKENGETALLRSDCEVNPRRCLVMAYESQMKSQVFLQAQLRNVMSMPRTKWSSRNSFLASCHARPQLFIVLVGAKNKSRRHLSAACIRACSYRLMNGKKRREPQVVDAITYGSAIPLLRQASSMFTPSFARKGSVPLFAK